MKRRLFTAIEPPRRFVDKVTLLHARLPRANWETQPHLTLSHFGDVEASEVHELEAALSAVSFEPFELHPDRLGVYREADTPSVVWIGFKPSTELESLHAHLSTVRSQFVSLPDRHSFNPHLTLARTQRCDDLAVNQYLDAGLTEAKLGTLPVDTFELFESNNFEYARVAQFHAVACQ